MGTDLHILSHGIVCIWAISFTLRLIYRQVESSVIGWVGPVTRWKIHNPVGNRTPVTQPLAGYFLEQIYHLTAYIYIYIYIYECKVKVKVNSPYNRPRRPRGEQRYSSTLSLTSALDGVGGQRHDPATLLPGKTRYPLYRRLGGPKAGLDGCRKSRLHRDSIPGPFSPLRVAISTELSRLSLSLSLYIYIYIYIYIHIHIHAEDNWNMQGP